MKGTEDLITPVARARAAVMVAHREIQAGMDSRAAAGTKVTTAMEAQAITRAAATQVALPAMVVAPSGTRTMETRTMVVAILVPVRPTMAAALARTAIMALAMEAAPVTTEAPAAMGAVATMVQGMGKIAQEPATTAKTAITVQTVRETQVMIAPGILTKTAKEMKRTTAAL